jgi:hypothetical protein
METANTAAKYVWLSTPARPDTAIEVRSPNHSTVMAAFGLSHA